MASGRDLSFIIMVLEERVSGGLWDCYDAVLSAEEFYRAFCQTLRVSVHYSEHVWWCHDLHFLEG